MSDIDNIMSLLADGVKMGDGWVIDNREYVEEKGEKMSDELEFEQFTETTTLVNSGLQTCGEIYIWEGEAFLDITTVCLTIADLKAIIAKMQEVEANNDIP